VAVWVGEAGGGGVVAVGGRVAAVGVGAVAANGVGVATDGERAPNSAPVTTGGAAGGGGTAIVAVFGAAEADAEE
jgi:hypothetical protein